MIKESQKEQPKIIRFKPDNIYQQKLINEFDTYMTLLRPFFKLWHFFENESVVNSVLKMPQFEGKFEIIDCSSMFSDIKRKKGLDSWDLNYVPNSINNDNGLLESLSSKILIKDIDKCMRFYPHQIHGCGTFIAVIKKIGQIEKSINTSNQIEDIIHPIYSKVTNEMLQTIKNDFGLSNDCNEIQLVLEKYNNKLCLHHVNITLYDILNKFGCEKLNLYHIGCLGFSHIDDKCDVAFVPSVRNLPSSILKHIQNYIIITFDEFKKIIQENQILINELEKKNQMYFTHNLTGGVCIKPNDYGPLIGGYINQGILKINEIKNELVKLYIIVKKWMQIKLSKKQLFYFNDKIDKNEKEVILLK